MLQHEMPILGASPYRGLYPTQNASTSSNDVWSLTSSSRVSQYGTSMYSTPLSLLLFQVRLSPAKTPIGALSLGE